MQIYSAARLERNEREKEVDEHERATATNNKNMINKCNKLRIASNLWWVIFLACIRFPFSLLFTIDSRKWPGRGVAYACAKRNYTVNII